MLRCVTPRRKVYVKGYRRKDGQYVRPHTYRRTATTRRTDRILVRIASLFLVTSVSAAIYFILKGGNESAADIVEVGAALVSLLAILSTSISRLLLRGTGDKHAEEGRDDE